MERSSVELCYCGKPLHYRDEKIKQTIERLVRNLGEYVTVTNHEGRCFKVQRHYIALHGLKEEEIDKLGFEETNRIDANLVK